MASRHRSRERALQILFQWDVRKNSPEEAIAAFYDALFADEHAGEPESPHRKKAKKRGRDRFMEQLVHGAVKNVGQIDELLGRHSAHWRLERMATVDRNILRLAVFELMEHTSPHAVAIDEALELARRFSNEESVSFINGVLDAAYREIRGGPLPQKE
jgi:transcription antitermination protein NusB